MKMKSLTHDDEFIGEGNLKIVQNYDVTYQMKEQDHIH